MQRKLRRRKVIKLIVFALFLSMHLLFPRCPACYVCRGIHKALCCCAAVYPTVSSRALSFFACRDVDGVSYMVADFKLQCGTEQWKSYMPLAVICVMVYPIGKHDMKGLSFFASCD
jgi:hypothetical protein